MAMAAGSLRMLLPLSGFFFKKMKVEFLNFLLYFFLGMCVRVELTPDLGWFVHISNLYIDRISTLCSFYLVM